jgi:hypothetical protein
MYEQIVETIRSRFEELPDGSVTLFGGNFLPEKKGCSDTLILGK